MNPSGGSTPRSLQTGQEIRYSSHTQSGGRTAAGLQSSPRLRSEPRTPIELQLFPGQNLCLRDAIALDLVVCPNLEALLDRLSIHIRSGILPPLTVLAMVLSALHANFSRGRVYTPVVGEKLLSHTIANMPEECRLEALLVFHCLQGGRANEATLLACEQSFVKRYANLASKDKAARLEKWAGMQWWDPAICNFAGHAGPGPMKRMAVRGLLAVLGPRLQGRNVDSQRHCLTLLLQHLYPEQSEIPPEGPLDLAPWKPCLDAWAAPTSRLEAKDLANLMLGLLMPILSDTSPLWPYQAEILLAALSQSMDLLGQEARHQVIGEMLHLFTLLAPKTFGMHHSNARLTVSLSMKMLKLLHDSAHDFAKSISNDLRMVINADPQNSPFKPNPAPTHLMDDCKMQ